MWAQESRIILVIVLLYLINSKPGQNCLCGTRSKNTNRCFFRDKNYQEYQCLRNMNDREEFLTTAGSMLGMDLEAECNYKNRVFTFCIEYLTEFD